MFLVIIDYASIVGFFLVLAGLLLLLTRQHPEQAVEKAQTAVQAQSSPRVQTISYGLLAGLLSCCSWWPSWLNGEAHLVCSHASEAQRKYVASKENVSRSREG